MAKIESKNRSGSLIRSNHRKLLAIVGIAAVCYVWLDDALFRDGRKGRILMGSNVVVRGGEGRPMLQLYIQGRLGNAIFQYATGMAIAKKNDMDFCSCSPAALSLLAGMFDGPFIRCPEDVQHDYEWNPRVAKIDELVREPDDLRHVRMKDFYFNNVTLFQPAYQEIISTFAIKSQHIEKAKAIMDEKADPSSFITVGIHARYGDKGQDNHWVAAGYDYYKEAMEFAVQTIRKSVDEQNSKKEIRFLVASEPQDVEWFDSLELPLASQIVHIGQDAFVDLTVLTLCDHLIISEGTYTFFAAWLTQYGASRKKVNDPTRHIFYHPRYFAPVIGYNPRPDSSWTEVHKI